MEDGCDHHAICGTGSLCWVFFEEILVVHLVWEFLVDVLVMKQTRPAEHDAQVLVQSVDTPEDAFA
jgi:hypothetical protein